jgi:hypothetical protein
MKKLLLPAAAIALTIAVPTLWGQARSARASAPYDPTGYWVSVITQNWRLRMVPPARGEYIGIPISAAGKKIADAWDPARDEATGNRCAAYGPPAIMTQPMRLHITWQDDSTLRMEMDAGQQTRSFHFGSRTPQSRKTREGHSVARWQARRAGSRETARYLRVTTNNMIGGYLRKNGVPYSDSATLTEYYDVFPEADGTTLMVVTAVMEDPVYLEQPYITASHFKKEQDASKWDPTPCSAAW